MLVDRDYLFPLFFINLSRIGFAINSSCSFASKLFIILKSSSIYFLAKGFRLYLKDRDLFFFSNMGFKVTTSDLLKGNFWGPIENTVLILVLGFLLSLLFSLIIDNDILATFFGDNLLIINSTIFLIVITAIPERLIRINARIMKHSRVPK